MRRALIALGLCIAPLLACGGEDSPAITDAGDDMDAGDAAGFIASPYCPPADHPRVHYLSTDLAECGGLGLQCTIDQNGFDNTCGCGCIDKGDAICPDVFDPAITWVSIDPADCDGPPDCPLGDTPFSNSCGCGCTTH